MGVDEILDFVEVLVGPEAKDVLRFFLNNPTIEITDEELAQRLDMNINEVRRALYRLSGYGLVTYRRHRNEVTGWYTYYWRISPEQLNQILLQRKKAVLKRLEEKLRFEESNELYFCPTDNLVFTFDEAFENYFRCPKCDSPLERLENSDNIKKLREIIRKLREEIANEERALSS